MIEASYIDMIWVRYLRTALWCAPLSFCGSIGTLLHRIMKIHMLLTEVYREACRVRQCRVGYIF